MQHDQMFYTRRDCRLCASTDLTKVLDLPQCPPVDNFRYANDQDLNLPAMPMNLYMCSTCGHAQLLDVVDPSILFGNYIYTSTSSPDLDIHFSKYCDEIAVRFTDVNDPLIIDIGSNDGLLLAKFKAKGWHVQGVDPALSVARRAIDVGIPTLISFLTKTAVGELLSSCGPADVVSANNVFSHADDLRGFADCVRSLLKPNGVFVFEVSYLRDLVEGKVFDYIYHEHLAHHSVAALDKFFRSLNMRLFDVIRISTKGGSIRGFACREDAKWETKKTVLELSNQEHGAGLYDLDTYSKLQSFIVDLSYKTMSAIDELAGKEIVAAYGASATGTVLTRCLGISNRISFVVDDNVDRQARLCPGSYAPVMPRQSLLDKLPPVTFLSAWRFSNMIIQRNIDYLKLGGAFIVPLPEFRVVRG